MQFKKIHSFFPTFHIYAKVSRITIVAVLILYVIEALSVYLVWGQNISTDFILNLDPSHKTEYNYAFYFTDDLARAVQFIFCVGCFCGVPYLAFESRTNLHAIVTSVFRNWSQKSRVQDTEWNGSESVELYWGAEETNLSRIVEGLCLVIAAALVALFVTDFSLVLVLIGAIYGTFVVYLLPAVLYLRFVKGWQRYLSDGKSESEESVMTVFAVFMIAFGSVIGVIGVIAAFI